MGRGAAAEVQLRRGRVEALRRALSALGPLSTLDRGFAIATGADGAVLEDASMVAVGDPVQVRLRRGALTCRVTSRRAEQSPRGSDSS